VNDANNPADATWTVTATTISRSAHAGVVNYSHVSNVRLVTGDDSANHVTNGHSTYQIEDIAVATVFELITGNGSNAVNVLATHGDLTVNDLSANSILSTIENIVTVGNGTDGVQDIHGAVTVENTSGPGSDKLIVNDAADTRAPTLILDNGQITRLAPATIQYLRGISSLNITTGGTGNGREAVEIHSTHVPTVLTATGFGPIKVCNSVNVSSSR